MADRDQYIPGKARAATNWTEPYGELVDLVLQHGGSLSEILTWLAANADPSWQPGGDYTIDGGTY